MNLDELIQAIGVSVHNAEEGIRINALSNYFKYMDETPSNNQENDTVYSPKMKDIVIPTLNGKEKVIKTPIIALVNHNNMALDKVTIKLNVGLDINDKGSINATLEGVNTTEGGTNEIELIFKCNTQPEGISRITQEAINLL